MTVQDLFPNWPKEGESFSEEQAKFMWLGACVERENCVAILEEWAKKHGISGSAIEELRRQIGAPKPDPYGPFVRKI